MTESPIVFGPASTLVGVLTLPAAPDPPPVVWLLFNAGLVSRMGPHRLNVKLARALAAQGHVSLRFDLSGRGDSRGATSGADFEQQSVHDIRSAMDCLEHLCGARRFALFGICSGAVAAFATAQADPRVAAALLFDGHAYSSRWTLLVRRWKRFRAASWPQVWRNIAGRFAGAPAAATAAPDLTELAGANPPLQRADFVRQLHALVNRQVAVCFLYSGSWIDAYSYGKQFRHAFASESFVDKVRCEFHPDIDHTVTALSAQRKLIDIILAWLPAVQAAGLASGEPPASNTARVVRGPRQVAQTGPLPFA